MQTNILHLGLGWFDDHAGGLERYQHGICTALAGLDVDVEAFVLSSTPQIESPAYRATVYASPSSPRVERARKLRAALTGWLNSARTGGRFIVSHHASVAYPVMDVIRKFQSAGGAFVVQFQGPWADEAAAEGAGRLKMAMQRRMERSVYRAADRVITLSTAFNELVVERYDVKQGRVSTVPGGINLSAADPGVSRAAARARLGWPGDRPTVVCIRRLVRRVGVDVLVEAMRSVADAMPEVLLVVGGRGPMLETLRARVAALGLAENVRLLGFVPDDELPLVYAAADLSVVPTQSLEGFGLVTLESMAAGTPSLVTPVGSLPEVMTPLSPALVTAGADARSIAASLIACLRDPGSLPDAVACRTYVRDCFDWSVIAPRVLAVYTGQIAGTENLLQVSKQS